MIYHFSAVAKKDYVEDGVKYWSEARAYPCKSDDMRNIAVLTDQGTWGMVGIDNMTSFDEVFTTDYRVDTKNMIPYEFLSYEAKDHIYREVWKEHVMEDIKSYAEENGHSLTEEELVVAADRYVYMGDYDCNLSYWQNISSLIERY